MSHWQELFGGIGSQQKGIHISLLQHDVTALMIAVYDGHSHIVEVLVRFKPDVNLQTKVSVVTYSSCVSCAVTCYTTPFQWSGGLDHLNALRSGIQSLSNERVFYTRSPAWIVG